MENRTGTTLIHPLLHTCFPGFRTVAPASLVQRKLCARIPNITFRGIKFGSKRLQKTKSYGTRGGKRLFLPRSTTSGAANPAKITTAPKQKTQ